MGRSDPGGLNVLVVEDESLIAMMIEDALTDLNCTVVAMASNLGDALDKASSTDFDIAILDVNLGGAQVYPVADILIQRKIPFIFLTGYGAPGVPEEYRGAGVLAKPFNEHDMGHALEAAMTLHATSARQ